MPPALVIDGEHFRDDTGRVVTLRGINLAADAKFPAKPNVPSHESGHFFDGDNVSFVGRPFPLADAPAHFARLKRWGFNIIRYVFTWEAIEHKGPGIYDDESIAFTVSILQEAKKWDMYCILDPHQDSWSRFSGGSGAPLWTLYAAGLDPKTFKTTEAALVHNTYADPAAFPKMVWATNYQRLACFTIFTLFFAGREFAPKCIINGKNIQDFLQDSYYAALHHFMKAIPKDLLDTVVIGWETMNEPNRGFIGYQDLAKIPASQKLKKDSCPTPFQAILLGSGRACEVETWDFGGMGPYKTGTRFVDPQGTTAWLDKEANYDWKRDPGWKLGECVWAQHGVWDPSTDTLLKPAYFAKYDERGFNNGPFLDFYRHHVDNVKSVHPTAFLFMQSPVLEIPPSIKGTDLDDPRLVFVSHWYDGITLLMKHFNRSWNVDVVGVLRGRYLTPAFAIKLGETAIRNCFRDQLASLRKEGVEHLGVHPCLIGEIGIPFDMQDKKAYQSGDYADQLHAMDANMFALEGSGTAGFTWWTYVASNNHKWGDNWNGEDLSVFSVDDKDLVDNITPDNVKSVTSTPSVSSMTSSRQDDIPGNRAIEALIRPAPIFTNGTLLSYGFDLKNCIFTMTLSTLANVNPDLPTEIFLPALHFPKDPTAVQESSGRWIIGDDEQFGYQMLKWYPAVSATGAETDYGTASGSNGETVHKIEIRGVRTKYLEQALADDDGYIEQCRASCVAM